MNALSQGTAATCCAANCRGQLEGGLHSIICCAGHWGSMAFYGYCLREGVMVYPAVQALAAMLLAAGLALHIWAAASLGKVLGRLITHHMLSQHTCALYVNIEGHREYFAEGLSYASQVQQCMH